MFKNISKRTRLFLKILMFVIPIIAIIIATLLVKTRKSIKLEAALGTANIFIQPVQAKIPTQTDFQVWLTTNNPIGFVSTEIDFDKTKIKVTSEIDSSTNPLKKQIILTSMAEANSTGKILIMSGLNPTDVLNPPNGTFKMATIKFAANTQTQNSTTNITVNSSTSQVVGMDQSIFTITSANSAIVVNPAATSTPTATSNIIGDVNDDWHVNLIDIGIIVDYYDQSASVYPRADLNNDGVINLIDIGIVIDHYE